MTRILITGVRGKTGRPLAQALAGRSDVEVLGGSSNTDAVDIHGVQAVEFAWERPETWSDALDGVDAVYLVRPELENAPELIGDFLARTSEGTRVVQLSEQGAETLDAQEWAARVEHAVQQSGRPWTMVRPGWFTQVFLDHRYLPEDPFATGRLLFPSNGQAVSWIDTRDIAAVAELALLEEGHEDIGHELTGPEALTLTTIAELLSRASDHTIDYHDISIEKAVGDATGFERENSVGAFEGITSGSAAAITSTVQDLTGRPARTVADFIEDLRQNRL